MTMETDHSMGWVAEERPRWLDDLEQAATSKEAANDRLAALVTRLPDQGNRRRDAAKTHREVAVARARAAVAEAIEATQQAYDWLTAFGAERFLTERVDAALEQLAVVDRLLNPDQGS